MDAFLECGLRMPHSAYLDWLEDGLRRSMLFERPDLEATEREIEAAAANYGSIVEALRAGAMTSIRSS